MKRHGELIGIKRECVAAYIDYHCAVWPEVAAKITECNIRNYTIFMHDGLLFAYYEYVGDDFDADMAKMAEHPKTHTPPPNRMPEITMPNILCPSLAGLLRQGSAHADDLRQRHRINP